MRAKTISVRPRPLPLHYRWAGWLGLLLLMLAWLARYKPLPTQPFTFPTSESVWGSKPVLGYFALTPSLVGVLQSSLDLSRQQLESIQSIARQENEQLEALAQESLVIIKNPDLTLEEKRLLIREMDYNPRVNAIIASSEAALHQALGRGTTERLASWVNARWPVERYLHGGLARPVAARTYRIFATRYDSKGAYTVALPDQCLKFANAGNHLCDEDGYVAGGDYSIYISYESGVAVRVGEAGPWNIDDNFWATTSDPAPRRMFADLGLGMPEAQAAYFNGYNGGKDQFGRTVTAPFAIDLAREVSIDIGLKPGVNDWVNVTFMFTDHWGASGSAPPSTAGSSGNPAPTQERIEAVQVATPDANGAIIHEVKSGQALWSIAIAYKKTILEIQQLNGLSGNVIVPGQKLVIVPGSGTPAATSLATQSPAAQAISATTLSATQTQTTPTARPSSTPMPTRRFTATSPLTASPTVRDVETPAKSVDPVLGVIIVVAILGTGMLLYGALLRSRGA